MIVGPFIKHGNWFMLVSKMPTRSELTILLVNYEKLYMILLIL